MAWKNWASAAALAGATAGALLSCDGEHRPYARERLQARPGADAGDTPSGAQPAAELGALGALGAGEFESLGRAAGEACGSSADCSSGFCVDGVCCRSSCDTVCSRCDAPGSEGECTVAANDAACSLSCPANGDCRSYGSGALTANCEAVGLCRASAECRAADAPAGTACELGAGSCDDRASA